MPADHVDLKTSRYKMRVEPQHGALVSSLVWLSPSGVVDLLFSPAARPRNAAGISLFGCWPLVPFCNRCEGGRLVWKDRSWRLPINEAGRTMHGCGWQRAWRVVDRSAGSVGLDLACEDFGPYRFGARLDISLDAEGVRFAIEVSNLADEAMPYGLGFHPWFPCGPRTHIAVPADYRAAFGEGYRALGKVPVSADDDFREPRRVWRETEIAVNFLDFDGVAALIEPGRHRIDIAATNLPAPLLWRPPGADYVCFEPQSHVIGAACFDEAARIAPLRLLAPGERMSAEMRLSCHPEPAAP